MVLHCYISWDEIDYTRYEGIAYKQNKLVHLYYLDEGNACMIWVGYDIVNVSIGYCMDEVYEIK